MKKLLTIFSTSFFISSMAIADITLLKCTDVPIAEIESMEIIDTDDGFRLTILKDNKGEEKIVESYRPNEIGVLGKPVFSTFNHKTNKFQFVNYYNDHIAATDSWHLIRKGSGPSEEEKNKGAEEIDNARLGVSTVFYNMNCEETSRPGLRRGMVQRSSADNNGGALTDSHFEDDSNSSERVY